MSSNINRKPLDLDEMLNKQTSSDAAPILDENPKYKANNNENVQSTINANASQTRHQNPANIGSSIKISSIRINKIKDRIFILSPKVKSGEDRESSLEDFYVTEEQLKYGCLGNLVSSIHKVSKVKYALKIIKKEEIIKLNFVEKINTFIDGNYRFTNQNVIKFINHFEEDNHLVFIYSHMKLNLLDFINKHFSNDDFYENLSMQYFIQTVGGLLFLNTNKKYNIDIRPENIMIDKQNIIKITDIKNKEVIYNFFKEKSEKTTLNQPGYIEAPTGNIILDYYSTPEELNVLFKNDVFEVNNLEKSDKSDVWRLGALLFHLVGGKAPYSIYDNLGLLSKESTTNTQKKSSLLRDLISDKELSIEIYKFSNTNINATQELKNGQECALHNNYGDSISNLDNKDNKISAFTVEYRKKVESLVRTFMDRNFQKRPTIKEFKENQNLKSLLAKYKISRSSVDITSRDSGNHGSKSAKSKNQRSGSSGSSMDTISQEPVMISSNKGTASENLINISGQIIGLPNNMSNGEGFSNNIINPKHGGCLNKINNVNFLPNSTSESGESFYLSLDGQYKALYEENAVLKKENEKYKSENLRLENENKILTNEINGLKSNYDKDRKIIEEEKKRMMTLNQDRISKINELDEMTNEIIELKSKYRLLENDVDMIRFDLKEANETIEELQEKIDQMNVNFENERCDYKIKIENLNKNLLKMQKIFFSDDSDFRLSSGNASTMSIGSNTSSNIFQSEDSMKKFAVALFDLVKEFKETLDKFVRNNFTDKAEILFNINQLISEKEDSIKNYIKKVKEDFLDDYLRVRMKPISATNDKSRERYEWIQKQVIELTPFKIKSINLEQINNNLVGENKRLSEILSLKTMEIELLRKLNEGINENVKNNDNYISVLESKLGYIKDFVFKHLPHCLEELKI